MEISDFDRAFADAAFINAGVSVPGEIYNLNIKKLFSRLSEVAFIYNSMFNAAFSNKIGERVLNYEVNTALRYMVQVREQNITLDKESLVAYGKLNLQARQNLLKLQEEYGLYLP